MRKLVSTILSLVLAAVVLAAVPVGSAEASYWGTIFDFSEQTVTVARGSSKRITMYTEKRYSIDVLDARSKQTGAWVVGRSGGRDIIEIRIPADETASRVRFRVYVNDGNHKTKDTCDYIYVNVTNAPDTAAYGSSAASASVVTSSGTSSAAIVVGDNADYFAFQQAIADAVTAAPQNARITVNTGTWNSLYTMALDALAARTDVVVTVNWVQNGEIRTFTMPAGTVTPTLRDENGFLGFEHLQKVFG